MTMLLTIVLTGSLVIAFYETSKWLLSKGYYAVTMLGALTVCAEVYHNIIALANEIGISNGQSVVIYATVLVILLFAKNEIENLIEEPSRV